MRIWHCLKIVMSLLLAFSTSTIASAQGLFSSSGGGTPAFMAAPGQATIGYAGMSPSFRSHPFISPFDHALERHFSSDGLWYRDAVSHFDTSQRPFEYDFQAEWVQTSTRYFKEQVGDLNGPTIANDDSNALLDEQVIRLRMFFPPLMGQMGNPEMDGLRLSTTVKSRDGWRASFHGIWNGDAIAGFSARADRDRYRGDEVKSLILEQTNGIGNPGVVFSNFRDTSDLEIILQYLLISGAEFDAEDGDAEDGDAEGGGAEGGGGGGGGGGGFGGGGLGIEGEGTGSAVSVGQSAEDLGIEGDGPDDIDLGLRGTMTDALDRALLAELDLPLKRVPSFLGRGVYQRFDIEFAIRHSLQTYGAGTHFESGTLLERNGIQFRGLIGGRWMRINEGFHFRGIDSGLSYSTANDEELLDRIDNDGDYFVDDIEEGGAGGDYESYNPSNELLVRAFVDSRVRSDLAGPEFGFSYDLGKRMGITLRGSSRVGALFNDESLALAGDNIGHFPANSEDEEAGLDVDPLTGESILEDLFDTSTSDGQLTQNAFTDVDGSLHLSPMFEQQLTANIPLFGRVPVLREIPVLQNSSLQVGWTFLWVGEVAEPHRSIVWESNPRAGVFPHYNVHRGSYYQNSLRLGINCEY